MIGAVIGNSGNFKGLPIFVGQPVIEHELGYKAIRVVTSILSIAENGGEEIVIAVNNSTIYASFEKFQENFSPILE